MKVDWMGPFFRPLVIKRFSFPNFLVKSYRLKISVFKFISLAKLVISIIIIVIINECEKFGSTLGNFSIFPMKTESHCYENPTLDKMRMHEN